MYLWSRRSCHFNLMFALMNASLTAGSLKKWLAARIHPLHKIINSHHYSVVFVSVGSNKHTEIKKKKIIPSLWHCVMMLITLSHHKCQQVPTRLWRSGKRLLGTACRALGRWPGRCPCCRPLLWQPWWPYLSGGEGDNLCLIWNSH